MKITSVESLHCNAGWANLSFLKITTDDGIIGYSEYNQSYGSMGLSAVIDQLSPIIIGSNPLDNEVIFARLYAITRQAPGGINAQAIAAIENALLDVKGKALGIPVYQLLGGAARDRIPICHSVGIAPPDSAAELAMKVIEDGIRYLQVKVPGDPLEDLAIIK